MSTIDTPPAPQKNKLNISFDLRIVTALLLLVIVTMLFLWQPWSTAAQRGSETIEITGEATVTDVPDEFVFYPSYQFENENKEAALAELTKKSDDVTSGLKKLGIADKSIKTNSNGYEYPGFEINRPEGNSTYNLQLTVRVADNQLAQKAQDYLLTTAPLGGVSPQVDFSDAKRKQLESKARDEATKDARAKAEQSAKNLGFKVGKVKSVSDSQGFGVYPLKGFSTSDIESDTSQPQLALQPGENELNYYVTVVYYIR